MPVITQTLRPSVTGDGDDMFCFIMRVSPPPSGRFHERHAAIAIDAAQRVARSRPSATLRKMWSPQTIGVEPDQAGSASFQAMFSFADHFSGRFFSPLSPFSDGPRHCGQFSADARRRPRCSDEQT